MKRALSCTILSILFCLALCLCVSVVGGCRKAVADEAPAPSPAPVVETPVTPEPVFAEAAPPAPEPAAVDERLVDLWLIWGRDVMADHHAKQDAKREAAAVAHRASVRAQQEATRIESHRRFREEILPRIAAGRPVSPSLTTVPRPRSDWGGSPGQPMGLQSASGFGGPAMEWSEAVQCSGTTQEGRQCRRRTKDASGYCYQHD